jgi:hypothetical protein
VRIEVFRLFNPQSPTTCPRRQIVVLFVSRFVIVVLSIDAMGLDSDAIGQYLSGAHPYSGNQTHRGTNHENRCNIDRFIAHFWMRNVCTWTQPAIGYCIA